MSKVEFTSVDGRYRYRGPVRCGAVTVEVVSNRLEAGLVRRSVLQGGGQAIPEFS